MEVLRIFLVDDDHDDQEFFSESLSKINGNFELSKYNSGAELVNEISTKPLIPDIIFLDLYMPVITGEDCLKALRRNSKFDSVPIVIYSTEYDIDRIAELFKLGANRYLKKPDSFDSLVASIKVCLSSLHRNALGGNAIINVVA
ncbi:response regulator [Zobellia alginiliquefaciens]|uniref:response regulator n=1 Tax=Zobellia alginiliquefaciens TaxID=3032586 RepID=UPI0023E45952|nr:response regulator [Zobellia alginiliquefaciens]